MKKSCKQCRREVEEDIKFCPNCGKNQENDDSNPSLNSDGIVPTIEVLRESSFIGCLFSYIVFVDDVEIGRISNGEKKRFELTPGLHEVYIKLNWSWCYSPKVSFLLKDFKKFRCKPTVGLLGGLFGRMIFYVIFKRHKLITLKEV